MTRRWTTEEEQEKRKELIKLYIEENKTIAEIGKQLGLAENSVYDRLVRLGIPTQPTLKPRYGNRNTKIAIPTNFSVDLAEFIGILLGDGHITPTQVTVSLGKKEDSYLDYVHSLMQKLFKADPRTFTDKNGDRTAYFGSVSVVEWLLEMGLVHNKVGEQVDIPTWIKIRDEYKPAVLRGLIDTDGSVYKLRWGCQISFTNRSRPLLNSARNMFLQLGFHPSKISRYAFYLTRRKDLAKFYEEVGFRNPKHIERFREFFDLG